MHDVVSQLTAGMVMSFFLQEIKKSRFFPWLTMETAKLNRIAAGVLAALTALGIHFAYTHVGTTWTFTFSNVSLPVILHGLWDWLSSFAFQQGWYKAIVADRNIDIPKLAQQVAQVVMQNLQNAQPRSGGQVVAETVAASQTATK